MKRKLRSGNTATFNFGFTKRIVSISFLETATKSDQSEAEKIADKYNDKL